MPLNPSPEPSDKMLDVLRYIILHIEENGYQPTQAEMAAHFGVTKNAIQGRLKELAKRNIIEMPAGTKTKERAIILKNVKFKAQLKEESE